MTDNFDTTARLTSGSKQDAPWVEKFRPKSLDEVAAHKEIIDTSETRTIRLATNTQLLKERCMQYDAL